MGIKAITIVLLLFASSILSADNNYFNKLRETTNLQKNEQLVVVYQQIGSCVKCYLEPLEKISNLDKEGKISNYKLLAMVLCDRKIELNIFKKQTNWKYYLYRDDGYSRKHLGVSENTNIVILNYFGKILIKL